MMRSIVEARTRFVSWSVERRVPRRVRPSVVRMRTFSVWGGGLGRGGGRGWGKGRKGGGARERYCLCRAGETLGGAGWGGGWGLWRPGGEGRVWKERRAMAEATYACGRQGSSGRRWMEGGMVELVLEREVMCVFGDSRCKDRRAELTPRMYLGVDHT